MCLARARSVLRPPYSRRKLTACVAAAMRLRSSRLQGSVAIRSRTRGFGSCGLFCLCCASDRGGLESARHEPWLERRSERASARCSERGAGDVTGECAEPFPPEVTVVAGDRSLFRRHIASGRPSRPSPHSVALVAGRQAPFGGIARKLRLLSDTTKYLQIQHFRPLVVNLRNAC